MAMERSDGSPGRPEVWLCDAKIDSNPDISGIGVISAFFFQGFVATLIGVYMYYASGRWARLKTLPLLIFKHIKNTRRLSGITSIPRGIHPANPLRAAMMADMIVLTSDMQTLSGIALMVAALSQLRSLSAYHATIVANMGWIPSQSHHLAIIYIWESRPHGRHYRLRYAAIMVYAVLYTVFCVLTYVTLRRRWDLHQDCFRTCTASSCVGGFRERDSLLKWKLISLVLFVSSYTPVLCNCVKGWSKGTYPWLRFLGDILFSAFWLQVTTGFWAGFTLYGVTSYKRANRTLLGDGSAEETWGFGQVIAVVSLLLVVFEFWKSYIKYNEPNPEDPGLCHCTCFCGKRVGSFSSGETLVSVNF